MRALDKIDRAILAELSRDARTTNTELAGRVGLTSAPCLRRVRRLEEAGVIAGYRAMLDPVATGRACEVIVAVEISMTDVQTTREFEDAVAAFDEVTEVRRLLGRPDYFLRVNVADLAAYENFVMNSLTRLPAIHRIESHQTMKIIKSA
ncbi:DNA-binding Lrp family transcriptional regulator [Kribbella antiqua]|uniref:DNA-binding Lrp family transcriptional regulator n=2 Tax=Kribbella antiqua TaxID=2512217 RepID=A0A4R2IJ22_9ACTN|nr:DNA-binding Lrp family transcriptional regulator [Kribbella antiqua]